MKNYVWKCIHLPKLVPIERFCNKFRANLKGSDLNINNFAVLLHFRSE